MKGSPASVKERQNRFKNRRLARLSRPACNSSWIETMRSTMSSIPHSTYSVYIPRTWMSRSHAHKSPDSSVNTTETPYRYAGYASRIRSLWLSYHRYVAYASEVGEAHRPVAPQWLVRSAYAVSWAYVLGDVAHEGYKAFLRNRRAVIPPGEAYKDARDLEPAHVLKGMATANIGGSLTEEETQQEQQADVDDPLIPWATKRIPLNDDYRMVMAQRMAFHSIATIGLPALTIHSVVRYSGRALRDARSSLIRRWVPIGVSTNRPCVDRIAGAKT